MAFKTFVDSDTLLDFLLQREPFVYYSQSLLNKGKQKQIDLCTSALIIANVHYMLSKSVNRQTAKLAIKELLKFMQVFAFENEHVKLALDSEHVDFEDTVQFYIAKQNQCNFIISRNTKHFKKFDIPVLTAEQFLRQL